MKFECETSYFNNYWMQRAAIRWWALGFNHTNPSDFVKVPLNKWWIQQDGKDPEYVPPNWEILARRN